MTPVGKVTAGICLLCLPWAHCILTDPLKHVVGLVGVIEN